MTGRGTRLQRSGCWLRLCTHSLHRGGPSEVDMQIRQMRQPFLAFSLAVAAIFSMPAALPAQPPEAPQQPTFRTSVAIVPITAVVRDGRRRLVRNLGRDDFQVLEHGAPRRIIEFSANDDGPVSVALLFDTSGS